MKSLADYKDFGLFIILVFFVGMVLLLINRKYPNIFVDKESIVGTGQESFYRFLLDEIKKVSAKKLLIGFIILVFIINQYLYWYEFISGFTKKLFSLSIRVTRESDQ